MFTRNRLEDFFEEQEVQKNIENVLMIDLNNLMYRTLAIADFKEHDDLEFRYWKYLFLNNIFNSIKMFEPTKVIVAVDGSDLWRRKIYSEYKAGRKESRKKSTINFEEFFKMFDKFLPDMIDSFTNFHILKHEECEADDIIAVLTRERFNDSNITLISTDKDFIQLLSIKKFNLYNPITKLFVKSVNPQKDLQIKILMGDKSDNISPVRKGVGPATALKLINEGIDGIMDSDEIFKKKFELNKSIIDFSVIPSNIKNLVFGMYDNYSIKEYNSSKLWQFLIKHRLESVADDLNLYSSFMRRIK